MKAENTTTAHNRVLRLTEIPGDALSELTITVNYVKNVRDPSGPCGVTIDKYVIPAIIDAINKAHAAQEHGKCRPPLCPTCGSQDGDKCTEDWCMSIRAANGN